MKPKGTQFFQYTMFEPAGKLADPAQTVHGDVKIGTTEQVRRDKIQRSKMPGVNEDMGLRSGIYKGASLYDSIKERGVVNPVSMLDMSAYPEPSWRTDRWLRNGHHRVFAAADIDPHMEIPVTWRKVT